MPFVFWVERNLGGPHGRARATRRPSRPRPCRLVGLLEPIRPGLHRYCRKLTGDLFDAEDLVQDTLLRGFATMGSVHRHIENPSAYLVRIATHLWIDALRRRDLERAARGAAPPPEPGVRHRVGEARDAGAALLQLLPPQERAAFVMKEVFEMTAREIADVLATTVGAVKAALHRGRGRLQEAEHGIGSPRPRPPATLVERFVECMRAADLDGLLALMLDGASIEVPGSLLEIGREQFDRRGSWLWQSCHVHPDLPEALRPKRWEAEAAVFRGEPVMLSFSTEFGGRKLQSLTRVEELEGRVARVRAYYMCPETMQEVAAELGLPLGPVLYRLPPFMALRSRKTGGRVTSS